MDVCWNQYPAARPSFEGVDFALATGNSDAAKDGSDTSFHSSLVQSRARMRRASKALAVMTYYQGYLDCLKLFTF